MNLAMTLEKKKKIKLVLKELVAKSCANCKKDLFCEYRLY